MSFFVTECTDSILVSRASYPSKAAIYFVRGPAESKPGNFAGAIT